MIDDIRARLEHYESARQTYDLAVADNPNFSTPERRNAVAVLDEAVELVKKQSPADLRALLDQHDADQTRITALEGTLQFYADLANWPGEPDSEVVFGWYMGTAIDADFGAQARAALSSHDD